MGLPGFMAAGTPNLAPGGAEFGRIDRVGCRTVRANDLHGRIARVNPSATYKTSVNESETITAAKPDWMMSDRDTLGEATPVRELERS